MRIILIVALLAAGLIFLPAYAQGFDSSFRFYPAVPTEKSRITVISSVVTSIFYKVEPQGFALDGKELSVYVKTIPPPSGMLCAAALAPHAVKQEIGMLGAGLYNTWLYADDMKMAGSKLYVSPDDVAVLSTGKYTDDQGGVNLVGEVRNDASQPVKRVRVDIDFLEGEQVAEEKQIYTTMGTIMPNRTSGFSLALDGYLADKDYAVRVTSYSVQDEPVEKGLALALKYGSDKEGYGIVDGTVFNRSDHSATQVKIVCAIYDVNGKVIDSIFGYTDPDTIPAGQDAKFGIATHAKIAPEFTASCNTESVELAMDEVQVVPEFPAVIIAAGSVAAALAIGRFYYKIK
jgi:hypothetical protein